MALVAFGAAPVTSAQAQALAEERCLRVASLGYGIDAKRDYVKDYPKFSVGQKSSGCALYPGEAADQVSGRPVRHLGFESVNTLASGETSP